MTLSCSSHIFPQGVALAPELPLTTGGVQGLPSWLPAGVPAKGSNRSPGLTAQQTAPGWSSLFSAGTQRHGSHEARVKFRGVLGHSCDTRRRLLAPRQKSGHTCGPASQNHPGACGLHGGSEWARVTHFWAHAPGTCVL